jgi:hypothetical protein
VENRSVSGVKGMNDGDGVPLENKIQTRKVNFGIGLYGGWGLWVVEAEVEIEWHVLLI